MPVISANKNINNKTDVLFPLAALALVVLVVMNKSMVKIPYLDWSIGAVALLIYILQLVKKGSIPISHVKTIGFSLLWLVWPLILTPFYVRSGNHLPTLVLTLALVLLATIPVMVVFERDPSRVLEVICTLWVGLSLIMFLLFSTGLYTYTNKSFSGIYDNRNEFSITTVIVYSLLLLFSKPSKMKIVLLVASFIMVVASQSITGFLGMGFITFYPIFIKQKLKLKLVILVAGLLSMALILLLSASLTARFMTFILGIFDLELVSPRSSAYLRIWLLQHGFALFMDNFWTGVGLDNSRFYLIPPDSNGLYTHNNYLELLVSSGLPAAILHYVPLFYVYRVSGGLKESQNIKLTALLYLLLSFPTVSYFKYYLLVLYVIPIFLYFHGKSKEKLTAEG